LFALGWQDAQDVHAEVTAPAPEYRSS